mgnify:CR=1 FL=1
MRRSFPIACQPHQDSVVVERLSGPGADDLYATTHAAADGSAQTTTVTLASATSVAVEFVLETMVYPPSALLAPLLVSAIT